MHAQRGRPRDERVERKIREAVVSLLTERGYGGTTIERVAKQTGLGRPTIYRRHASREAMINHVVEALLDESLAALSEHVDPYANVQNHLVNTVEMLTNTAIGPIYRAVIAEIPGDAELSQIVSRVGQERRRRLRRAVRRAIEAGALSLGGSIQ